MLSSAEAIGRYVERGRATFDADPALRDAIVHQIEVLGEAAKAILVADPSLEAELPEIAWSELSRMRDKMIHQYWALNGEIVWSTAVGDVPTIRAQLESFLSRQS